MGDTNKKSVFKNKYFMGGIILLLLLFVGFLFTRPSKPQKALNIYTGAVLGKIKDKDLKSEIKNANEIKLGSSYKNVLDKQITIALSGIFDISQEEIKKEHSKQITDISNSLLNRLKENDINYKIGGVTKKDKNYAASISVNSIDTNAITNQLREQIAANLLSDITAVSDKKEVINTILKHMPKAINNAKVTSEKKSIKVSITRKWYQNKWTLKNPKQTTEDLIRLTLPQ